MSADKVIKTTFPLSLRDLSGKWHLTGIMIGPNNWMNVLV